VGSEREEVEKGEIGSEKWNREVFYYIMNKMERGKEL